MMASTTLPNKSFVIDSLSLTPYGFGGINKNNMCLFYFKDS